MSRTSLSVRSIGLSTLVRLFATVPCVYCGESDLRSCACRRLSQPGKIRRLRNRKQRRPNRGVFVYATIARMAIILILIAVVTFGITHTLLASYHAKLIA